MAASSASQHHRNTAPVMIARRGVKRHSCGFLRSAARAKFHTCQMSTFSSKAFMVFTFTLSFFSCLVRISNHLRRHVVHEALSVRRRILGDFVSPVQVPQLDLAGVCAEEVLRLDVAVSNSAPMEKDQSVPAGKGGRSPGQSRP